MNASPLRVLILEDSPADAQLMAHELQKAGYELDWQRVETEAQFLTGLEADPDLILADFNLPQYSALQALAAVRARKLEAPFLVVSGAIGEETAVESLQHGASDCVMKDRLARLGPAVKNALEQQRLRALEGRAAVQLRLQSAAMDAAANGIVITDRNGAILYVNPAFTAMTGYSREEAVGHNPRMLKSGKLGLQVYEELWDTILAGKVWRGELTNKRKDGTFYLEFMTITPVRDEKGVVTHFIAIKQDVTERKQLEARFLQAQKMEAFGQLAGGVAHDFNNLLTVIGGFSQVLLGGPFSKEQTTEMLTQISKAADRAAGLTSQLLAFSRKQVLQPQVLNLNELVAEQEKMLRRLIGEDVELLVQRSEDLDSVRADPGQMQQVIMNLAVNARDAMPTGGKLTLTTRNVNLDEAFARDHPKVQPGRHVLLEVSDTGSGMTPEVLVRIFEPFFTTKGVGKGTGLGLATVFGIVDQSGGVIDVESQPGQGSTFRIYLPRSGGSASAIRKVAAGPMPRGKETILLVEDDDAVRRLAALILRTGGYTVLEARRGAEAEAMFDGHGTPIALLVTDVVMPEMGGPQLAARLAARDHPPKVLYMSGYLDDAVVRHGLMDNSLAFLQKPLTPTILLQKVREVLDGPCVPV